MADKTLKARIKLKYNTLTNWQGEGASVVLLKGEVAVCEVPTGGSLEQVTPPAILFKVGDGVKTFAQLPWVSGLAADVYAWAKAATKPTYTAAEVGAAPTSHTHTTSAITDFTTTVNGLIDDKIAEIPTVEVPEYTLESGAADGSVVLKKDGVVVGTDVLVKGWAALKATADSALQKADITSGSANGTISVDGTDVAVKGLGSAAYTASSAYAAADHDHEIADVTGLQGALDAKASLSGAAFTGAVTVQTPTAETNPATKKYVDDVISAAASGSPKGTYATLAALKNAYPNGTDGIYVVLEDGKWYYWNTSNDTWTAGGTYLTAPYDTELSVSSNNAVQNNAVSKVARKVPTNIYDKTYKIYSWVYGLGPHFDSNCLGHMCSYDGYTTCDYLCVNVGDVLHMSILEGITQIRVSKYSIDGQGKITGYDGIDTYEENTELVFTKNMLVRVSVRGSSTPSFTLAQSAVTLTTCRSKEEVFVYPYGPWVYPKQYLSISASGISSALTPGPNGDPYWDTVSIGFRVVNGVSQLAVRTGYYVLGMNLNYMYVKYGINKPSLMVEAYWKNNDVAKCKIGMVPADGSVDCVTTDFVSMSSNSSGSIYGLMKYTGDLAPVGTTKDFMVFIEMQGPSSTTSFLADKEEGDELFNSVEIRVGLRYDGEPVDLSRRTRENGISITYKGLFPFVSTQSGGQKPSCMSEYDGKLFVGCDDYGCNIVNLDDLTLVATIANNSLEHFNNSEFTDEKYDATDTYPLLMVGNGTRAYNNDLGAEWSDYIKSLRFANDLASFSVVKKYVLPTDSAGFWCNGMALDNDSKTLWVLGYKTQSYESATGNALVLTSWDLTNCQTDDSGNYIPTIKTRCELPWVRALQDMTFCNGYIFALADSADDGKIPSSLYVIDTVKQTIRRTVRPSITPFAEIEAITKVFDEEQQKYYLLIGEALFPQYGGVDGTYGHIYRLDTNDASVTRKQIQYSEIAGTPSIPTPAAGKLLDATGTEIFNANQTDDSTIIVIDCGSATELVD